MLFIVRINIMIIEFINDINDDIVNILFTLCFLIFSMVGMFFGI